MIMILGISIAAFTLVHVVLSLIALISGFIVVCGLLSGKKFERWTLTFLSSMILTDATGYGFPTEHLLPSQIVGAISLLVLVVAIIARYRLHLRGGARSTYAISIVVAVYLDAFVAVVQAFLKVPSLKALAPTQSEPPFAIVQGLLLLLFVGIGVSAFRRFKIEKLPMAAAAASR
jgi:hypothetical protein